MQISLHCIVKSAFTLVVVMNSKLEVTSTSVGAFVAGCVVGGVLAAGAVALLLKTGRTGDAAQSSQVAKVLAAPAPWDALPTNAAKPVNMSPSLAALPLTDSVELRMEQFSRNRQFFGEEAQARIEKAFVVVIGVGGVGSHAAHMLARAGVARLRIVDFDNVSLSSLNRHAVATRADVGTPKVVALKRALAAIVPSCSVEAIQAVFDASRADELLGGSPDLVLDCIDDKDTKLALLHCCFTKRLRAVCSLGAGGRADPTRICIADLAAVRGENLSSALRLIMRKDGLCGFHGIPAGKRLGRAAAANAPAAKGAAGTEGGAGAGARTGAGAGAGTGAATGGATEAGGSSAAAAPGDCSDSDSDADDRDAAEAGSSAAAAAAHAAGAGQPAKHVNNNSSPSDGAAGERNPEQLAAVAAKRHARKQVARDRAAAARARGFSGLTPATIAAGEAAADPLTGITCVFSSEVPRVNLLPLEMAEGEAPSDFGALPGFRVRVIPVLGCIPAMFGQAAAAYALCELAGPEHSLTGRGGAGGATSTLQEGGPLGPAGVVKLLNRFMKREQLLYRPGGSSTGGGSGSGGAGADAAAAAAAAALSTTGMGGNPLGHEDVSFIMDDVWRQRSGVSPQRAGHKASFVELCRWRLDRPSVPSNVVAVAEYEADRMHAACEAGFAAAIGELRERAARAAVAAALAVRPSASAAAGSSHGAVGGAGAATVHASAPGPATEPCLTADQVDALSRWQLLNSPRTPFGELLNDGRRPAWLEAVLARHHAAAIAAEFGEQAAQFAAARLAWVRSMGYQ